MTREVCCSLCSPRSPSACPVPWREACSTSAGAPGPSSWCGSGWRRSWCCRSGSWPCAVDGACCGAMRVSSRPTACSRSPVRSSATSPPSRTCRSVRPCSSSTPHRRLSWSGSGCGRGSGQAVSRSSVPGWRPWDWCWCSTCSPERTCPWSGCSGRSRRWSGRRRTSSSTPTRTTACRRSCWPPRAWWWVRWPWLSWAWSVCSPWTPHRGGGHLRRPHLRLVGPPGRAGTGHRGDRVRRGRGGRPAAGVSAGVVRGAQRGRRGSAVGLAAPRRAARPRSAARWRAHPRGCRLRQAR